MTTNIDNMIPFLPWTISVYLGCFLFWCITYAWIVLQPNAFRNRFFCTDILAKGVCLIIFLALPTTNIRPVVSEEPNIWNFLMSFLYSVDSADNLFPSLHCFVSWLCFIGVRSRKDVPLALRLFSCLFALAVCISTLTTKQHVIADVFAGVALAETSYAISGIPAVTRAYEKFIDLFCVKLVRK